MKEKFIKGTFTSVWSCGEVSTHAVLDTETGELNIEMSDYEIDNDAICEREYFTDKDGNEYKVCNICHSFITKSVMKSAGKCLDEVECCMNKECDSNEE